MTAHTGLRRLALLALLPLLFLPVSCDMERDERRFDPEIREWYPSQEILIPVQIEGPRTRYIEYLYEFNAGGGWEVGESRFMRTVDSPTLIAFTAGEPDWQHRITLSALTPGAPGEPLEVFGIRERYFGIDTTTPSSAPGVLTYATEYGDRSDAVAPYDDTRTLEMILHHPEFDAPSGSPIDIFIAEVNPYNSGDPGRYNPGDRIRIWDGGEWPKDKTFRLIVVDKAGNRSAVRELRFTAP